MKKIICLLIASLPLLECNTSASSGNKETQTKTKPVAKVDPNIFFTLSDAEKILGEPSHLTDSTTNIKDNNLIFNSSFTANSKDQKSEKTGVVYFVFEQYAEVSSAQKTYASIKIANQDHEGFKELHDLGDEAYFHSDGENFYFIMVRKGEKIFRIKVNKITSSTSLDQFNLIAKNITDAL